MSITKRRNINCVCVTACEPKWFPPKPWPTKPNPLRGKTLTWKWTTRHVGNEQHVTLACLPTMRLHEIETTCCKYSILHSVNNKVSRVSMFFQFCNGVGATFWTQWANPVKNRHIQHFNFRNLHCCVFSFVKQHCATFWMSIRAGFEICSIFQTKKWWRHLGPRTSRALAHGNFWHFVAHFASENMFVSSETFWICWPVYYIF